jgi:predicted nuclease of predicted toxin-antitoxin system
MRFLLDMGITPRAIPLFAAHGHEAHRCNEFGLQSALDEDLVALASRAGHVLVTTDKRFGDIVMLSGEDHPSVVILRLGNPTFEQMLLALQRLLETFTEPELEHAIVVVEPDKIRHHGLR